MSKTKLEKAVVVTPVQQSPFAVAIPSEAEELKARLLIQASEITEVKNEDQQEKAVSVVAELKAYSRDVKKLGDSARQPFRQVCDDIIQTERKLTTDIDAEAKRAESLIAAYQAEQRRKAEIARREEEARRQAALEEERRQQQRLAELERQRIAAEQRKKEQEEQDRRDALERERLRIKAEQDALAAEQREKDRIAELERQRAKAEIDARNAKDQAERDRIAAEKARIDRETSEAQARAAREKQEAELEKARVETRIAEEEAAKAKAAQFAAEEAARVSRELFDAEMEAQEASSVVTEVCTRPAEQIATGVKGGSVAEHYDIEVRDVHALYAAHRQCVELTPKINAIKDLIKAGFTDIPGVSLIQRVRASVRASKQSSIALR